MNESTSVSRKCGKNNLQLSVKQLIAIIIFLNLFLSTLTRNTYVYRSLENLE